MASSYEARIAEAALRLEAAAQREAESTAAEALVEIVEAARALRERRAEQPSSGAVSGRCEASRACDVRAGGVMTPCKVP